ncbi:MAG: hypothetical protein WCT18_00750 [Patescibacteria group bacterium]
MNQEKKVFVVSRKSIFATEDEVLELAKQSFRGNTKTLTLIPPENIAEIIEKNGLTEEAQTIDGRIKVLEIIKKQNTYRFTTFSPDRVMTLITEPSDSEFPGWIGWIVFENNSALRISGPPKISAHQMSGFFYFQKTIFVDQPIRRNNELDKQLPRRNF